MKGPSVSRWRMRRKPRGSETRLSAEEVGLLRSLGYEVRNAFGRTEVRPSFAQPPGSDQNWMSDRYKVYREIRFCQRHPEAARVIQATGLLDRSEAYRLWREVVVRGTLRPEALLGEVA